MTLRRYLAAIKKGKAPENLDLSSLKHFFNAAEPISASDIDDFVRVFSKNAKLKANAIVPGYGLAEHVVYVCDGGKQRLCVNVKALETNRKIVIEEKESTSSTTGGRRVLVGCGVPCNEVDLRIVREIDDDTGKFEEIKEDCVGEIWLRGKSKTNGYWDMPKKSREEIFFATIEKNDDGKKYFRTGDLGFLHNKELFICGRLKDMIIVRGRNYYPQDLERCAEEQDSRIRQGCTAAFSFSRTKSADEEVAMVVEIRDGTKLKRSDLEDIVNKIHSGIVREHGVAMYEIVLLKPRTVSKTSSGKIQRQKNKLRYLNTDETLPKLEVLLRWGSNSSSSSASNDEKETKDDDEEPSKKKNKNKKIVVDDDLLIVVKKLKNEIADLLMDTDAVQEIKPSSLDGNASLLQLGLASMQIEQLRGVLMEEYKLEVDIQHFFQESTSIHVIAKWTKEGAPEPLEQQIEKVEGKEEQGSNGQLVVKNMQIESKDTVSHVKGGCCVVM